MSRVRAPMKLTLKLTEVRGYPAPGWTLDRLIVHQKELGNEIVGVSREKGYIVFRVEDRGPGGAGNRKG